MGRAEISPCPLCLWLIHMHIHSCTDTVIQCPRCQPLASSRCLKTGGTSVLDSPPSCPLPLATFVGERLAVKSELTDCLSAPIHPHHQDTKFLKWDYICLGIMISLYLPPFSKPLIGQPQNQTLLWVSSASRSPNGSSFFFLFFKSLQQLGGKWHQSLCPFSPLDKPAAVSSGPLCGCCSLATASLSPCIVSPLLSLLPNSPHTLIILPLTSLAPNQSYQPHSFPV